jgi:hypothetical protein
MALMVRVSPRRSRPRIGSDRLHEPFDRQAREGKNAPMTTLA